MREVNLRYEGVIKRSGITIYMYGTHTLSSDAKTVALQSTTIDLDRYINKTVIVEGKKIEGYPVDDGPELINVERIAVK